MLALIAMALAVDTVVYGDGDAEAVRRQVATASGIDPEGLRVVALGSLLAGHGPTMVGGGKLSTCGGPPSSTVAIRQALDLASGAVAYMEYGSARAALERAVADLACLPEPVDAAMASRVWFLLGIVAADDQSASRAAFRQARLLAPDMVWDDNFKPSARGSFDAVAAELRSTPTVSLRVVPEPAEGSLRIDGRPVRAVDGTVGVAPGVHLVQAGSSVQTTMTVEVDANAQATLVLPSLLTPAALDWPADPERRDDLAAVLVALLGTDGVVYVARAEAVWRVRLGGSAWDLVTTEAVTGSAMARGATGEPLPSGAARDGRSSPVGPVLLAGGGVALIAGGVVAGLGYSTALDAYTDAVENGRSADGDARYVGGGEQYTAGWIVGGVGAALLATGLVVTVGF